MRISAFPKGDLEAIAIARSKSVFDWIDEAAHLQVEGLELYYGMFWETSNEFVDRVGEALARAGKDMPMLCVSPDFTHPDEDQRAREIDMQLEMISIAARLGGPGVSCRVLTGQAHPGVSREEGIEHFVSALETLLPVARELDVTLALENHYKDGHWKYAEFAQQREVFLDILARVEERAYFGVQFDPSNAIVAGDDPVEFLELVKNRVVTMQASDRFLQNGATLDALRQANGTIGYSADLKHGVLGLGLNDYPAIFRSLSSVGYDGWISIEDGVNGMHEMEASVEFLIEARDTYFNGSRRSFVAAHEAACAAVGRPTRAWDTPPTH